jgi:hypothetical protein
MLGSTVCQLQYRERSDPRSTQGDSESPLTVGRAMPASSIRFIELLAASMQLSPRLRAAIYSLENLHWI